MNSNNLTILKNLDYDSILDYQKEMTEYIKNNSAIKKNDRVAVKLNLVASFHPDKGVTTHPDVVKLMILALLPFDCEIMICEDIHDSEVLVETGIKAVLDEFDLDFYNLKDYGFERVEVDGIEYDYSTLVRSCDILISMPKYKTHFLTIFTGAIKNMYGCISKANRKEFHKALDTDGFADIICSIYSIRIPDLVITDAIVCMEGMGPSLGEPKYLGYLVMGTDGTYVDYYLSNVVGYNVDDLPVIQNAIKRGLTMTSFEELKLIGGDFSDRIGEFARLPIYKGKFLKKYLDVLKRTYKINEELCIQCGVCVDSCPFDALVFEGQTDNRPIFFKDKCMLCVCCMELCPENAITLNR